MRDARQSMTTNEYAKITGIPVSTITQMLRQGKLRGEKRNGKWAIDTSEIGNAVSAPLPERAQSTETPSRADDNGGPMTAAGNRSYDVAAFAQLTYLTEKGVQQWFKAGRLSGSVDDNGRLLLDAANLERPELRHLIRK